MKKNHLKYFLILLAIIAIGMISSVSRRNVPHLTGTENWQTFQDTKNGISFKYPENLSTKFVNLVDWPPKIQVLDQDPGCTEAGKENVRAGKTEIRKINGRDYCLTTIVEGAAGSMYTEYAYSTKIEDKYVFFTFTTRTPQCDNYDDPNKTDCKNEVANLNIDNLVDQIFQTLEIK